MRKLVPIVLTGVAIIAIGVYFVRSPSDTVAPATAAASPLTIQQEQAACLALHDRREARERAALDAEPTDPAWADPMEHKLRDYFTHELQSGRVQVTDIDCRTTFCEIEALPVDSHNVPANNEFSLAISNLAGKSWNDFNGLGMSFAQQSGKVLYTARLTRPQFKADRHPPEEEPAVEACAARSMEAQERLRSDVP